jgi:RimJ/RimL family protein N-acetyltransferase
MQRVLADPNVELMLVEADAAPAGMVRLDRLPDEHGSPHYEVSIAICAAFQGRGIAAAALRLVRSLKPTAVLEAEILPANTGSIALFRRAGYAHIAGNRYHSVPVLNPSVKNRCRKTSS